MKALEDYNIQDVAEYLRDWGYVVIKPDEDGEGLWVTPAQLANIEHLLVCGQKEAAQNDLFDILGETLGRSIA
jgi:hypothetical protein